jgi:hypothetical protein
MQLIEYDEEELSFQLEHNSYKFTVRGKFTDDMRLIFEPEDDWNSLSMALAQDTESLYEDIDDIIYNVVPHLFNPSLDDISGHSSSHIPSRWICCPRCEVVQPILDSWRDGGGFEMVGCRFCETPEGSPYPVMVKIFQVLEPTTSEIQQLFTKLGVK